MALVVQKYGGTSVGSPEKIKAVASCIARLRGESTQVVVVVSAMGHTTDELIDLAQKVSKTLPEREMDMLLSAGERISMALLSMALKDQALKPFLLQVRKRALSPMSPTREPGSLRSSRSVCKKN